MISAGRLNGALAVFVLLFCLSGCSQKNMKARWLLFRAEQIYFKANYTMKARKISFENRKPYYRQACDNFLKAFDLAPELFHAARMEEASLSCSSADDRDAAESLQSAYAEYCRSHPKECEYGDMPAGEWTEL